MTLRVGCFKPWVGKTWARRGEVGQRSTISRPRSVVWRSQSDDTRITDKHKRKTFDLWFPYATPVATWFSVHFWHCHRRGFGGRCRHVGKQVFSEHLFPVINTVLHGKIRSHPRFHAQQVR